MNFAFYFLFALHKGWPGSPGKACKGLLASSPGEFVPQFEKLRENASPSGPAQVSPRLSVV